MLDAHRKLTHTILSAFTDRLCSSSATTESQENADSHKDEGFLKSVWHKLTDNPTHKDAAKNDSPNSKNSSSTDSKAGEKNATREDPKTEKKV
jgi:molecular chaperone DnaJ